MCLRMRAYRDQTDGNVSLAMQNKVTEERILRLIDELRRDGLGEPQWLAVAATHIEQGFAALNRAIFKPTHVNLED